MPMSRTLSMSAWTRRTVAKENSSMSAADTSGVTSTIHGAQAQASTIRVATLATPQQASTATHDKLGHCAGRPVFNLVRNARRNAISTTG